MDVKPKCPWPKPHMREVVKRAIDRVGGQRGFEFMGRGMREAIIDAALFHEFQTAAQFGAPTFDGMVGARRVAYEIAGLWSDDHE